MSYPIDLSITGKPSPRVEHPSSAGKRSQTPLNINRTRSLQSDVFATNKDESRSESPKQSKSRVTKNKRDEAPKNKPKPDVKFKKGDEEEAARKDYAVHESSRKAAQRGVPRLSLDEIIDDDDDVVSKVPPENICDPSNRGSPSCGQSVKQKPKPQNTRGGGWQVSKSRPSSVKTPSSRKHEDVPYLDLKLSQSNEALGQMREVMKQVDDDIQIEYMGKPKQKELDHLIKVGKDKKHQLLEEAILADQLSNLQTKSNATQAEDCTFGFNQKFDTKVKRHNDLHSSSVLNFGNEADISKRLRFGARILSLNGHDARREINGFFITSDNTITLYEFRHFGTRSKALPLIQRGAYTHVTGHRKGEACNILDIAVDKNLTFETEKQSSISDSLKKQKYVTLRITDVDEENKGILLFDRCRSDKDRKDVKDFITFYYTREKKAEKSFIHQVRRTLRSNLKSYGGKVMTNLHHHLAQLDKSGDGLLKKEELKQALKKYRIEMEDEVFENVWKVVDFNEDGILDYGQFVRGFLGEMSEECKSVVRKAFARLDPNKRGVGELNDVRKYYCPSKHPSVLKGDISEAELLDEFIQCFRKSKNQSEIFFSQFEAYYEGVHMGIDSDQSFINLLRMSWNI